MSRVARRAALAFTAGLGAAGFFAVRTAASFEQTQIAFEGILGDVERSNALIHVVSLQRPGSPFTGKFERLWAMCEIAEATGGRCWEASSLERIRGAFSDIADTMSRRYVLRYEPQGVKRPGWHKLDVRLKGRSGDVQARRGYWVAER